LQHGGAAIRLGAQLKEIVFADTGRVSALEFAEGDGTQHVELDDQAAVVLAVPPDIAQTLVPGLQAPKRFSATVNVHFAVEPPFGVPPLMGLLNGTAEWLFAFDGRLSVTISGADRFLDTPHEALAKTVWAEVAQAASLPLEPMPAWQLVSDPHATFAALPGEEMRRPGTRTRWKNLTLAGDWTATGLPATIEGAVRSGQKAADTLLNEPMERR
jgi:hydroxysqualene dehydroxylase